jgi:hypothetical protein
MKRRAFSVLTRVRQEQELRDKLNLSRQNRNFLFLAK